jgi:hypothetical protein
MLKHKEIQNENDVKALIKNYNLLRISEKIESRKSQINTLQTYASEKISTEFKAKQKSDRSSQRDGISHCKLHNLPYLYCSPSNSNNLLCETCIKTLNCNYLAIPRARIALN